MFNTLKKLTFNYGDLRKCKESQHCGCESLPRFAGLRPHRPGAWRIYRAAKLAGHDR
jgi:hypothetical protein